MKAIMTLIVAATLASPVQAALRPAAPQSPSGVILAAQGCGEGWHRGPQGYCHPNGGWGRGERACPRGYHLGPKREACWPN